MTMSYSSNDLYEGLVSSGLIIPVGVRGIFGRSAVFEDVLKRFDDYVSSVAEDDGAEKMLFPPTLDRKVFERSEFLDLVSTPRGHRFQLQRDRARPRRLERKGARRRVVGWFAVDDGRRPHPSRLLPGLSELHRDQCS